MKVSILQSNYIPWRGYFDMIKKSDYFVLYDHVQYTKNDWRNRNKIKINDKAHWVTIPVEQKRLDQSIRETKIARNQSNWNYKHFQKISQSYSKSPCHKDIINWLEEIYMVKFDGVENLSVVNKILLEEICDFLDIRTKIIQDDEFNLPEDRNDKLIHICKELNVTTYISGPAAKCYIEEEKFLKNNIELEWMDYGEYVPYNQMGKEYIPNLSILDLLFNEGKNSSLLFNKKN